MIWIKGKPIILQGILAIILWLLISIGINSCCPMIMCVGADDLEDIFLMNFASAETDSVFVVAYKKGSDFRTVLDSFMVPRTDSVNTVRYDLFLGGKKISTSNDNKIYFTKVSKIYKISGFKTSEAKCKNCYDFKRLDGYEINGKFKSLGYIEIDKDTD